MTEAPSAGLSAEPAAGRLPASAALRLTTRAALASVAVALLLSGIKLVAWWQSGSVAMLAAAMDSLLDLVASLTNLFAIRWAGRPADRGHRFGHGKAEALAGLAQAAVISGSAVFLAVQSIARLRNPQPVEAGGWALAVVAVSLVATFALVLYQRGVVKRTGSLAIGADRLHYVSDLMMNLAVAIAIGLSAFLGILWADPLFGLGIGAYIAASAFMILRQSVDQLMDRELPEEERKIIRGLVAQHEAVRGVHSLRTRQSGNQIHMLLHIDLDPAMTLAAAHAVGIEVENALLRQYPDADILIHADPAGIDAPHGLEQRAKTG
jgi:ferrous-iron efflux pump FieF